MIMNNNGNNYSTAMKCFGAKAILSSLESHLKCNKRIKNVEFSVTNM